MSALSASDADVDWFRLPPEIWAMVLEFLAFGPNLEAVGRLMVTGRQMRELARDEPLWQRLCAWYGLHRATRGRSAKRSGWELVRRARLSERRADPTGERVAVWRRLRPLLPLWLYPPACDRSADAPPALLVSVSRDLRKFGFRCNAGDHRSDHPAAAAEQKVVESPVFATPTALFQHLLTVHGGRPSIFQSERRWNTWQVQIGSDEPYSSLGDLFPPALRLATRRPLGLPSPSPTSSSSPSNAARILPSPYCTENTIGSAGDGPNGDGEEPEFMRVEREYFELRERRAPPPPPPTTTKRKRRHDDIGPGKYSVADYRKSWQSENKVELNDFMRYDDEYSYSSLSSSESDDDDNELFGSISQRPLRGGRFALRQLWNRLGDGTAYTRSERANDP
ncbi:Hypothetical protein UVM_LOCUS283 [uncultured virus]|nr:Hypothetical protein UVM_LOCUS283 [uncultured virus]